MSGRISAIVDQRLCPCGSGLRAARCCALDLATLSPPEASRHLAPIVERARAAFDGHDIATAETLCLEVLELAPGREDALALLHTIRKAQGCAAAAEALARRLVSINPNNFSATNELALILFGKGALAEAEIHARNAVRIAPREPAIAQSDGHDPDRGQPAAGRRVPLSPRAGTDRRARPDPARQPRLEPEEPGPDGGGARAL